MVNDIMSKNLNDDEIFEIVNQIYKITKGINGADYLKAISYITGNLAADIEIQRNIKDLGLDYIKDFAKSAIKAYDISIQISKGKNKTTIN